jgi:hypothetical protein
MILSRNSGVDRLNRLHGVPAIASAQFPDFIDLANRCEFWMENRCRTLLGNL